MTRRPQDRRTDPGRTFSYTVDGEAEIARADEDGRLRIPDRQLEQIANAEGLGYWDDDEDADE